MAIKIRGLDRLQRDLENTTRQVFGSTFKLKLGKLARDIIYRRVKSGFGVVSTERAPSEKRRLKPLSQSYIEQREGRAVYFTKNGKVLRVPASSRFRVQRPRLGEFGSPRRSNLTFTGQMLNALRYEANARGISLFIENSPRRDDPYTNKEIAEFVQEQGRPFFTLTTDELTILIREIEREVRKITRRISRRR